MIKDSFFSKQFNLVIYGCGVNGERIVRWMKSYGIGVYLCVDSQKDKQGTLFMDIFSIQSPDVLLHKNNYHIIVSTDKNENIHQLLDSYNYAYEEEYIDFESLLKYWSDLLVSYIQKQKYSTKFIFAPNLKKMQNYTCVEKALLNMPASLIDRSAWLLSFPAHIRKCYKDMDYYSDEYLRNIFTGSEVLERSETYILKDKKSKYVNISNGMRITTDQPEYYERIVHLIGSSYVYGFGTEDKYTLPSCLQRRLNCERFDYIVLNHGVSGLTFENYINKIRSINISDDDDVLLYFEDEPTIKEALMQLSIPYIDITECLIKKRKEDIFFDWGSHLNYKGNQVVADKIFELAFSRYTKSMLFEKNNDKILSSMTQGSDYNNYIVMLKNLYASHSGGVIGGIVMNCNPFTLGHQHLIRIASQIVDILYIFVVSENCSEFDFSDRFQMVKEGTQDFSNVTVIPSGKFVLSAVTFPEYFSKEGNQQVNIDMSKDIEIFGSVVAKELAITIRFIGEEPNDIVTKQYNDSMKRILPKYNIKVLEIPRVKLNNNYISASIVRKLWKNGELEKMKEYVPVSTYNYLISMV